MKQKIIRNFWIIAVLFVSGAVFTYNAASAQDVSGISMQASANFEGNFKYVVVSVKNETEHSRTITAGYFTELVKTFAKSKDFVVRQLALCQRSLAKRSLSTVSIGRANRNEAIYMEDR